MLTFYPRHAGGRRRRASRKHLPPPDPAFPDSPRRQSAL